MTKIEPSMRPWTESQLKIMAEQHISWEASCLLDSIEEVHIHHDIVELNDYGYKSSGAKRLFNHPVSLHDIALHTRVLANFLECDSSCEISHHKKNFEARDYVESWKKVDILSDKINFYNGNVAHLGAQRLNSNYYLEGYERVSLALAVIDTLEQFITALSDERQVWFDDLSIRLDSNRIQHIKDEYEES